MLKNLLFVFVSVLSVSMVCFFDNVFKKIFFF